MANIQNFESLERLERNDQPQIMSAEDLAQKARLNEKQSKAEAASRANVAPPTGVPNIAAGQQLGTMRSNAVSENRVKTTEFKTIGGTTVGVDTTDITTRQKEILAGEQVAKEQIATTIAMEKASAERIAEAKRDAENMATSIDPEVTQAKTTLETKTAENKAEKESIEADIAQEESSFFANELGPEWMSVMS